MFCKKNFNTNKNQFQVRSAFVEIKNEDKEFLGRKIYVGLGQAMHGNFENINLLEK